MHLVLLFVTGIIMAVRTWASLGSQVGGARDFLKASRM